MQQSWSTRKAFFGSNSVPSGLFSHRVIAYKIRKSSIPLIHLRPPLNGVLEDPALSDSSFIVAMGHNISLIVSSSSYVEHHTKQPFSHLGKPYDNTVAETFFASLKKEELYRKDLPSDRASQASVASYIKFYNTHRTLKV